MLNEITKTAEINWIINNATIETPYADEGEDYTEFTFSGNIPSRMAQKIKAILKPYYNSSSYATSQTTNENGVVTHNSLSIKFGQYKSTQNNINFIYSTETH